MAHYVGSVETSRKEETKLKARLIGIIIYIINFLAYSYNFFKHQYFPFPSFNVNVCGREHSKIGID